MSLAVTERGAPAVPDCSRVSTAPTSLAESGGAAETPGV